MRKWLFSSRDYAYPWMRWLDLPLTRAGTLLVGGSIFLAGHSTTVTLVGVILLAVSAVVAVTNVVALRSRRRRETTA